MLAFLDQPSVGLAPESVPRGVIAIARSGMDARPLGPMDAGEAGPESP
jgi:hypothetical protein